MKEADVCPFVSSAVETRRARSLDYARDRRVRWDCIQGLASGIPEPFVSSEVETRCAGYRSAAHGPSTSLGTDGLGEE